eukprot:sb/3463306/
MPSRGRSRPLYQRAKKPRKTTRQSWTVENMSLAIQAVKSGQHGYLAAANKYGVPRSTLERRVKDRNKIATGTKKMLGNSLSVLPPDLELKLVDYVKTMEERLFGLTANDLRRLAYQLAERNNLTHMFNKEEGMAGYHWMHGFLNRHPELSLRKPENVSANRSRSFNAANVKKFFDILVKVQEEHGFGPYDIYNADEKGLSTVPNYPPRILALKGKKQVGTLASAERGVNTTVLLCGNAAGEFVPPFYIFPRKKQNLELLRGASAGSKHFNVPSGWMTNEAFYAWLEHFIGHIKCSNEKKALLILDGHVTHVKSLPPLELAKANGLIILCLPPHCTHKMQPLDVCVMSPLETGFAKYCKDWMRNNPGDVITIKNVAELFTNAYKAVVQSPSMASGFEKTGIWPLQPSRFDDQFTSAHQKSCTVSDTPAAEPSTPTSPQVDANSSNQSIATNPEDVIPIPVIEYKDKKKKKDRSGKTAIVTSSPYLKELRLETENKELKEQVKLLKRENKALKKGTVVQKKQEKKKNAKKRGKKREPSLSPISEPPTPRDPDDTTPNGPRRRICITNSRASSQVRINRIRKYRSLIG